MKKPYKLGVIGCGEAGAAVLRGAVLSDFIREKKIIVSDINEDKLDAIEYLGVQTAVDNAFVAQNSEYLVLAVSEKDFKGVVLSFEGVRPQKVISLITGITKSEIKTALGGSSLKVARCVTDMPCSIGSGTVGVDMSDFNGNTDDTDFISSLFGNLGTLLSVNEAKLNTVAGVSGNAVFGLMLIDNLISAGVKQGLTKDEAKIVAVQSVIGAAETVQNDERSVEEIIVNACKNCSYATEAVKRLENGNFAKAVENAVEGCIERICGRK